MDSEKNKNRKNTHFKLTSDEIAHLTHRGRIGYLIRQRRYEMGLSQEKLAEMVYVNRGAISLYELGKRSISTEILKDLCLALSLDSNELLGIKKTDAKEELLFLLKGIKDEMNEVIDRHLEKLQ